jgi:FAD/FMN-containing dehydrogenase
MNYLDQEQFAEVYPKKEQFLRVRQELDPDGLFLDDYSRAILGL